MLSVRCFTWHKEGSVNVGWVQRVDPTTPKAMAFEGVAALLQAFEKIAKNKALSSLFPPLSLVMALPSKLQ